MITFADSIQRMVTDALRVQLGEDILADRNAGGYDVVIHSGDWPAWRISRGNEFLFVVSYRLDRHQPGVAFSFEGPVISTWWVENSGSEMAIGIRRQNTQKLVSTSINWTNFPELERIEIVLNQLLGEVESATWPGGR